MQTTTSHSAGPRLTVGWSGPTDGGFGWLRQRIEETWHVTDLPYQEADPAGVERWIYASSDRLSLPPQALLDCGIPVAVATNAWWEGSSRTGLREMPTPVIPWYRWWDGWIGWLMGSSHLLSPLPPRLVYSRMPATNRNVTSRRVCIVSNCRQTAQMWQQVAGFGGHVADWFTTREICEHQNCHPSVVDADWLLWDDSNVDTWRGPTTSTSIVEFFKIARLNNPDLRIIAALTSPRWDEWQLQSTAGAQELIAKPAAAEVLTQILATTDACAV